MKPALLVGKEISERLRRGIKERADALLDLRGSPPRLAVLAIGGDAAARMYLRKKLDACKRAGVECSVEALPADIEQDEVLRMLGRLGEDSDIDGIIVEMPLPIGWDGRAVADAIVPEKDVEGVSSASLGRFYFHKSYQDLLEDQAMIPCTAHAIARMLIESEVEIKGKRAVVVGRSNIVGKPTAHLLSCLDATVTLAHSKTKELGKLCAEAEILVAALGKPGFIQGSWVREKAVVLDAGIHAQDDQVLGDVDFEAASKRASRITPVPGGIGPLTVTCLLDNTVAAAERRTARTLEGE